MVIQHDMPVVFGFAAPGAKISISIDGTATGTATAGKNGSWSLTLPVQKASAAPHNISAVSGSLAHTLTDVLFGHVWLCSGQVRTYFRLSMAFV
jgi:sialate O-acetylesterase